MPRHGLSTRHQIVAGSLGHLLAGGVLAASGTSTGGLLVIVGALLGALSFAC